VPLFVPQIWIHSVEFIRRISRQFGINSANLISRSNAVHILKD
jgi:hypothetical protein